MAFAARQEPIYGADCSFIADFVLNEYLMNFFTYGHLRLRIIVCMVLLLIMRVAITAFCVIHEDQRDQDYYHCVKEQLSCADN